MSEKKNKKQLTLDGFQGLKQNFSSDTLSGFLVFLLALPLSLGIAAASDFPAIYGLVTAMIGGIVVSLFAGSPLTIKGPAAGLIVIVAGSVAELGHGDSELGWRLALGAIVVSGIIQVIFGILRLGSLSDFFPLSAVHGMLAAIGIIIISKQLHILVGMNPLTHEGKPMVEPIELLLELKNTFANFFKYKDVALVGLVSLAIVFGWPMLPVKALKKIPSALIVLVVAIPLAMVLGIQNVPDVKDAAGVVIKKGFSPLLSFKEGLLDILGVKVSFEGFSQAATFIKFVIMFALVGSLEALLTVKAIDMLDPYKRKSNTNKDLIAVGIGNILSGVLGGLPMISEVARSSANVSNGGQTRWANFFHGFFILLFLIFAVSFSDLIPKAALAAMLIGVGWKLAHPKEFGHMAKIGADQIVVFLTTILVTLVTDLLLGIGAGILLKWSLHILRGVPFHTLFKTKMNVVGQTITLEEAAIFSNFLPVKKKITNFSYSSIVILDLRKCHFVDHTVIDTLHHLKLDFENEGGELKIQGIDELKAVGNSKHHLAALRKKSE
jgi:MFS superfamily sulfate permease-like transporter